MLCNIWKSKINACRMWWIMLYQVNLLSFISKTSQYHININLTSIIIIRQSPLDMHELNSLRAIVARKFYGLLLPKHKRMYIANLTNAVCDCVWTCVYRKNKGCTLHDIWYREGSGVLNGVCKYVTQSL